jgi:hypothetical protein
MVLALVECPPGVLIHLGGADLGILITEGMLGDAGTTLRVPYFNMPGVE